MADILGELIVQIKGDTTQFDKSINNAEKKSTKFAATAKKIGDNTTKFLTLPILGVGAASVKLASDLGESINAVNVVFGESANVIHDWGSEAAEQAGLSTAAFNETATTIGTLLKKSGKDLDAVAEDTIDLTKRAADLASVFNTDVKEATTALGAALRGETEPARRFGISLSAVAVENKALELGLAATKKEITESAKIQARYALILEESAQVAGDFSNTNDQAANSLRVVKAQLANTGAEIGQAFLPILTDLLTGVREGIGAFNSLDDGQKKLILGITGVVAAVGPAIKGITALKTAFIALNGSLGVVALAITGIVVAVQALEKAKIKRLNDQFGELAGSTGKTVDELDKAALAFDQLLSLDNKPISQALTEIQKEFKLTREQVIELALASGALHEEEKVELRESLKSWKEYEKQREEVRKKVLQAQEAAEKEMALAEEARLAERKRYLDAQELIGLTLRSRDQEVNKNQKIIDQFDEQIESLNNVKFASTELENQRLTAIDLLTQKRQEAFEAGSEIEQQRRQIEEESQERLLVQADDRFALLEREREKELEEAQRVGADKQAILEFYDNEEKKLEEEKKKRQLASNIEQVNKAKDLASSIFSIASNLNQVQLNNIENEKNAKIEALDRELLGEEEYNRQVKAIEKESAEESWKVQKEQLAAQKANSLIQIATNTAIGVSQALAQGGIFGIVTGAIVAAAGAAQAAVVLSQPEPARPQLNTGAIVAPSQSGIPVTVGENNQPELILGGGAKGEPLLNDFADKIAERQQPATIVVNQYNTVNAQDSRNLQRIAPVLREAIDRERRRVGV